MNPGGPLVLNLRKNLPASDEVIIFDREIQAAEKVEAEAQGKVTIASQLATVSQNAVWKLRILQPIDFSLTAEPPRISL